MTRSGPSPEGAGWTKIVIHAHPVAEEAVAAFLLDLGCEGISLSQGGEPFIEAYLPFRTDQSEIQDRIAIFLKDLSAIFPETRGSRLTLERVEDQDWGTRWRQFFHTDQVTPGLMIVPAWETATPAHGSRVIRIDPGPAFGTGQHPTTRMCLQAMEDAVLTGPWSMMDVGTGSGILSIYGVLLGAERVVGIDVDPEALRWAEQNIRLNGLEGRIELSGDPLDRCKETFSLVVANLTLGVILDLLHQFHRLTAPGGRLILSGILTDQVEKVQEGLIRSGFGEGNVSIMGEWACVTTVRSA